MSESGFKDVCVVTDRMATDLHTVIAAGRDINFSKDYHKSALTPGISSSEVSFTCVGRSLLLVFVGFFYLC